MKAIYYTAYSFIEERYSANQIMSRQTYRYLCRQVPGVLGIFLRYRRWGRWRARQEGDQYFVERCDWGVGWLSAAARVRVLRADILPYLFGRAVGRIWRRDGREKLIYVRPGSIVEGLYYLKHFNSFNVKKMVIELHSLDFDIPGHYYWGWERALCRRWYRSFFAELDRGSRRIVLVCIDERLKNIIQQKFGYIGRVEVIPSAHDNETKGNPKKINIGGKEAIYTGLSYYYRGVDLLAEALKYITDSQVKVRLVGGKEEERKKLIKRYAGLVRQGRLIVENPVGEKELRKKLLAADCALVPLPHGGFSNFTSPVKLFEYMALGMPIVVSDVMADRGVVVAGETALLYRAGDARDLARKIERVLCEPELARSLSQGAWQEAKKWTYSARVKKIISILKD